MTEDAINIDSFATSTMGGSEPEDVPEMRDAMSEHAVVDAGGLPFEPMEPDYNRETIEAMREALDIASGKIESRIYTDVDELFRELDEDCRPSGSDSYLDETRS